MRLVFSSSDIAKIGQVGCQFVEAGISCGIRYDPAREGTSPTSAKAELWVQSEKDFHRAVDLYLRLAGSAKGGTPDARSNDDAGEALWTPMIGEAPQGNRPTAST